MILHKNSITVEPLTQKLRTIGMVTFLGLLVQILKVRKLINSEDI